MSGNMKRCCTVGIIAILLLGQWLVLPGPAVSQEIREGQAASYKISASIFGFPGDGPYYHSSRWPAVGATHRTTKFAGSVKSYGVLGSFRDDFTGEKTPSFEFPANSGIDYLWSADLWIGGILQDDTLVSSGYTLDLIPGREFYPADDPLTGKAIVPSFVGLGTTYRVNYVDTFTANDLPDFSSDHQPLNLSIVQKSYSVDNDPYRNIMILDFIITNIGTNPIEKTYVGILVDGDVCSEKDDPYACWSDDLTGSLRDISTGYIIDNDGDPREGLFRDSLSPIDALALRPIMIYPPVNDTNYNWWFNGWWDQESDFGPRLRGTPADPFRDFGTGGCGRPEGDRNKYYILSHREWDYDQLMTATIDSTDSLWLYPNQTLAPDFSDGYDTRFLLSVGPMDLQPDSSLRAVFALFGADFVHIDPANRINLWWQDYHTFYRNLHFDVMRQTAERASNLAQSLIDPMRPPTGLRVIRMIADTALLSWDPWVFPGVVGYNIYLKPVDDAYLIGPRAVVPGVAPDDMGDDVYFYPAGSRRCVITDLIPGRLYFASIAHVTELGEGELSKPIVVGYNNSALGIPPVQTNQEFFFFSEEDSTIALTWELSENLRIGYYRIYKTLDPAVAADRYYPFITDDSSLFAYPPAACREVDGVTYCYY
ncbi:MAG: fibronectin type III domain-containing protein, partial [Candidatus Zixiibacteriota bacterium]